MSKQPFFLVWEASSGYTRFRHPDRQQAEREAERLARLSKGCEFIVLAPLSSSKSSDVVTEKFDYDDGIPF